MHKYSMDNAITIIKFAICRNFTQTNLRKR